MRIRLQLLANQNWRSNGCYQSLACAPGSGYENENSFAIRTAMLTHMRSEAMFNLFVRRWF